MHIVIPMSGIGKRFIEGGYGVPKPLIEIDGKPIIHHVVDLFPGETKFTFICNQMHLDTTNMRDILSTIAPQGKIVSIDPHTLGPVYTVSKIMGLIDDDEEVIVNYCDFGTYWDYADFLSHTHNRDADGVVVAYKGFHPHMLGTTQYAFMRDKEQRMLEIKEKEAFTNNRMQEYASNGTYYFKKGRYIKKYFCELMENDISLNGEFYVSLIYNLLVRDGLNVSIYNIQHMLQWGEPHDFASYSNYSDYFTHIINKTHSWDPQPNSVTVIPLLDHNRRFKKEVYIAPDSSPLISGANMTKQAIRHLPESEQTTYVCFNDDCDRLGLDSDHIKELKPKDIDDNSPLLISGCDSGVLWDHEKYSSLISEQSIDAIIWTTKGRPLEISRDESIWWANTEGGMVNNIHSMASSDPESDHEVIGAYYFQSASTFKNALKEVVESNERNSTNHLLEDIINLLINKGKKVVIFEVDAYLSWRMPGEYETYTYWQSYFHKNEDHAYDVRKDPTINRATAKDLAIEFTDFTQEFS